jgi:glycosyltransferase involved in cell wall biosynthesis
MVLAAIAEGLAHEVVNTVLTRRFGDTPARQEYEHLSVYRYPNPAPEVWKDYATGARQVSFPQKLVVTGLDILCSMAPLRRLAAASDLVHVHFPLPLGISALLVRPFVRKPILVTVHGNADVYELPRSMEPVTRAVLRRADAVVSVSRDLADYLRDQMHVADVDVISNGVNVELFTVGRRNGGPITLFSVSRLVPRKNVHVLIAAVERLVAEGADLSLVVAGTGPERLRIEQLARASNGRVRFVGFIDEARKRALLAETDVFVQLSTREGLSIATLEALASGVPCLVSDLPGVREPIAPGATGWYVGNPEDVENVVSALKRVLADRPRMPAMRRACREVAVERYSLEAMCAGYWNVFCRLLERRA